MRINIFFPILIFVFLTVAYLFFSPNPVQPVRWNAPGNVGFSQSFSVNNDLQALEFLSIGDEIGPEDVLIDNEGWIYVSVHGGRILRMREDGSARSIYAYDLGRPLGLALDQRGDLIVADAYLGLLKIDSTGKKVLLSDRVFFAGHDQKILYANNVVVAKNGWIYFTDSSTKFGAKAAGGSYPASLLDLMEHGGYGRVLVYKPENKSTEVIYSGLQFANGLALNVDETALYVVETGNYRILQLSLIREKKVSELIGELPGFPDNINRGLNGKYWVGLVSPRNALLDYLSDKPALRKMVQNLPSFMRPKATYYSHVFSFNEQGEVLTSLQDPKGSYPTNTSVYETRDYLYIASLTSNKLARLKKSVY